MRDYHIHYTGALPISYIYAKYMGYPHKQNFPLGFGNISSCEAFKQKIENCFSDDYKQNKQNFFEIYKIFQELTKPKKQEEFQKIYSEGCYEICKNLLTHQVHEFDLIAGPCQTIDLTYARLKGMIDGICSAENTLSKNLSVRIRLTFIRNRQGKIKNFSSKLLADIFELLKDPFFSNKVIGFDLSGEEQPIISYFDENCSIIKEISEQNKINNKHFEISIHAGENITNETNNDLYFNLFEKLTTMNINRISHGTFLWLDDNPEKRALLKKFALQKVIFDICPTANKKLTPLRDKTQIPLNLFKQIGLQYTFNRDNPSIFNNWLIP